MGGVLSFSVTFREFRVRGSGFSTAAGPEAASLIEKETFEL